MGGISASLVVAFREVSFDLFTYTLPYRNNADKQQSRDEVWNIWPTLVFEGELKM